MMVGAGAVNRRSGVWEHGIDFSRQQTALLGRRPGFGIQNGLYGESDDRGEQPPRIDFAVEIGRQKSAPAIGIQQILDELLRGFGARSLLSCERFVERSATPEGYPHAPILARLAIHWQKQLKASPQVFAALQTANLSHGLLGRFTEHETQQFILAVEVMRDNLRAVSSGRRHASYGDGIGSVLGNHFRCDGGNRSSALISVNN